MLGLVHWRVQQSPANAGIELILIVLKNTLEAYMARQIGS